VRIDAIAVIQRLSLKAKNQKIREKLKVDNLPAARRWRGQPFRPISRGLGAVPFYKSFKIKVDAYAKLVLNNENSSL
jgi:hypothetical protein